ncbi:MAG: glycerate kinase, partial [Gammaproteobacteria bacterium]|nr:glycerate kinase [Gammaproteobacteria bacterium]
MRAYLQAGQKGEHPETPKPGAAVFECVRGTVLATNHDARRAARREALAHGLRTFDLGDGLRGEARSAGQRLAAL